MENQTLKFSSNCLFDEKGNPNYKLFRNNWAIPLKIYKEETGIDSYIKASGAVKWGKILTNEKRDTKDIPIKEVSWLAGIGQKELMNFYGEVFRDIYHVSQILITDKELSDEEEGHNFVQSVRYDWKKNTMPISNFNDRLSYTEARKDNSGPAVDEAILLGSKRVIFVGTYDGFCDDRKQIIKDVNGITNQHFSFCNGSSKDGIGGMKANLEAIKKANEHGIDALICNVTNSFNDHINRAVANTWFHANTYK